MSLSNNSVYSLSAQEEINQTKVIFVKLTDAAIGTIEAFVKNQRKKGQTGSPRIQFNGNKGIISFPAFNDNEKPQKFSFSLTSETQGSFECIEQIGDNEIQAIGTIKERMKIEAQEDVYETTRKSLVHAAEIQNRNKIREVGLNKREIVASKPQPDNNNNRSFDNAIKPKHHKRDISNVAKHLPQDNELYSNPVNKKPRLSNFTKSSNENDSKLKTIKNSFGSQINNNTQINNVKGKDNSLKKPSKQVENPPVKIPEPTVPIKSLKTSSNKLPEDNIHENLSLNLKSSSNLQNPQNYNFTPITSVSQRHQYKEEFDRDYSEYLNLYTNLQDIRKRFLDLQKHLEVAQDIKTREEIENEIYGAYNTTNTDASFRSKRKRFDALQDKLAAIKKMIDEYDFNYFKSKMMQTSVMM